MVECMRVLPKETVAPESSGSISIFTGLISYRVLWSVRHSFSMPPCKHNVSQWYPIDWEDEGASWHSGIATACTFHLYKFDVVAGEIDICVSLHDVLTRAAEQNSWTSSWG